uniref:DDE-1 domain-containing protein n=1 Tax=Sparus aurata TaxID=8175 RepID=A0A671X4X5_SPAAU
MESALALWISHADDLSYDGVQIEFLPPNTTSLIQPMDQGIIRAFKALYTRNILLRLWTRIKISHYSEGFCNLKTFIIIVKNKADYFTDFANCRLFLQRNSRN